MLLEMPRRIAEHKLRELLEMPRQITGQTLGAEALLRNGCTTGMKHLLCNSHIDTWTSLA